MEQKCVKYMTETSEKVCDYIIINVLLNSSLVDKSPFCNVITKR